jgi:uncharacterized repeat protein (TIGR03803 family)
LTLLHSFAVDDGQEITSALIQGSDGDFYGTASSEGSSTSNAYGTVFRIAADGTLTKLHTFEYSDGAFPQGGLLQASDGNFYGTTEFGGGTTGCGGEGCGTVFRVTPAGAFTTLHAFTGTDGALSAASLVQGSDGNFYGTTPAGGANGWGAVYKITPAGVLTVLHSFDQSDGAYPVASLVQAADGNFYGTTEYGGGSGNCENQCGTVFMITPAGSLTTLYAFSGSDGEYPTANLVQGSDGNFYGTARSGGGSCGCGTVFAITAAGTLTTLHTFSGGDGEHPYAGLLQGSDGQFYGTAATGGGNSGEGNIYRIGSSGTFGMLYAFSGSTDGSNPEAGLIEGRNGKLYGTAFAGGSSGGTAFQLSPLPSLPSPNVTAAFAATVVGTSIRTQPAPGGEGPAGEETLTVQFCNSGSVALDGVYAQITQLGDGDDLLNATVGSTNPVQPGGTGAELAFPPYGSTEPAVPAGACITLAFRIGLEQVQSAPISWQLFGHR